MLFLCFIGGCVSSFICSFFWGRVSPDNAYWSWTLDPLDLATLVTELQMCAFIPNTDSNISQKTPQSADSNCGYRSSSKTIMVDSSSWKLSKCWQCSKSAHTYAIDPFLGREQEEGNKSRCVNVRSLAQIFLKPWMKCISASFHSKYKWYAENT